MIFHTPDTTQKRLSQMAKRCAHFARPGRASPDHRLAPAWENCKMMLDACSSYAVRPKNPRKWPAHEKRRAADQAYQLVLLDWFSERVDAYAEKHLLDGDADFAAMAWEFLQRLPVVPALCVRNAGVVEKMLEAKR